MTVAYIHRLPTSSAFNCLRLFTMWRGSIFKGVGPQLLLYCVLYTGISILYRFVLSTDEFTKQTFEKICVFCQKGGGVLPLDFILGFYVTQVVSRWWSQYSTLYWDNSLLLTLPTIIQGPGRPETLRRQIVRLTNLSNILVLRSLSTQVSKRFPSLHSLVESGLMTEAEVELYQAAEQEVGGNYQVFVLPISWAQTLLTKLRKEEVIKSDILFRSLQMDLVTISNKHIALRGYAEVSIPLVYTQLVTIAVHAYFLVTLFGQQYLNPTAHVAAAGRFVSVDDGTSGAVNLVGYDDSIEDFYVPIFTLLKFIFYFGWLHVASVLINPFGEDDEDFDLNYIIDRNIKMGYLLVKEPVDEEVQEDTEEMVLRWPPVTPEETGQVDDNDNKKRNEPEGSSEVVSSPC